MTNFMQRNVNSFLWAGYKFSALAMQRFIFITGSIELNEGN